MTCNKCNAEFQEYLVEDVTSSTGVLMKKALCPECKEYIKFLPQHPPKIYFGQYEGEFLHDIAKKDKPYLEWLLKQDRLPSNLRQKIEKVCSEL